MNLVGYIFTFYLFFELSAAGVLNFYVNEEYNYEMLDAVVFVAKNYFEGKLLGYYYDQPLTNELFNGILLKLHSNWSILLPSTYPPADGKNDGPRVCFRCNMIVPLNGQDYVSELNTILFTIWGMGYVQGDSHRTRIVLVIDGEISKTEMYRTLWRMYEFGDLDVNLFALEDGVVSVYTYYPFGTDGLGCPEANAEVTLLTRWNGTFNVDLFPQKVPFKFNGCKFPVSTLKYPPFMLRIGKDSYDGIDYRLLSDVSRVLNTTLEIIYYDHIKGWLIQDKDKKTLSGSLIDLRNGTVWASVSGVYNNKVHYPACYVRNPYINAKLLWYYPNPRPVDSWKLVYLAFNDNLWLCVVLSTLSLPVLLYYLTRRTDRDEHLKRLTNCAFVLWCLAFGNSTGYSPKDSAFRIIFSSWFFYTIHLNNAYTAALTGLVTTGKIEPKVETLQDIINVGYATYVTENIDFYIKNTPEPIFRKLFKDTIIVENYTKTFNEMIELRNSCLLGNNVFIDNFIKTYKLELYSTPIVFLGLPMGVMIKRNHFMFKRINQLIANLISAGINVKLFNDFTSFSNKTSVGQPWAPLTGNAFSGPYLLLIFGYFISTITFVVELVSYKLKVKSIQPFQSA